MRKENVVNNKGLSSRKSFVRDLPSAKSLLNKEQQPYCMKQAEGPGLYPALQPCGTGSAGTTTFFITAALPPALVIPVLAVRADAGYSAGYKSGFTLIELLVVVLIIGILAAVALPQYQKAVEKSRATEGLTLLKTIANANRAYHIATGTYATNIDDLDIEIPGTLKLYSIVGNRRKTKYFEYGANAYNNDDVIAIAQRLPQSTFYAFDYYRTDDTICCYAFSDKGTEICKAISNGKTNASHTSTHTCYQVN